MNSRLIKYITGLYLLLAGQSASADVLGLFFGMGVWQPESGGDLYDSLQIAQDAGDLGVDAEYGGFFYLKIEHPVTMIPDIKIAQYGARNKGRISWDTPVMITMTRTTDIDLDHSDYTFYWELIDAGIGLDLGLTARKFDGGITQKTFANSVFESTDHQPITGFIPMLYISANADLPVSGSYIGAEINTISYRGDAFSDLTARVGWKTSNWVLPELGVEAGYRKFTLDTDVRNSMDTTLDLIMDGYYVSLVAHF